MHIYIKTYTIVILLLILAIGCIQKPTSVPLNLTISEYTIAVGDKIVVEGMIWNMGPKEAFNISISLETKEKKILDNVYLQRIKAGESTKFFLNSTYSGYSKSDLKLILKVIWNEENGRNELEYLLNKND
ncbi:Uncharacterised protein [uncultured archaeon]|nr:Uncharacterised protein [uncultured archaeon]